MKTIGRVIIVMVAMPFVLVGLLFYLFIYWPVVLGWELGEDAIKRLD